MKAVDVRSGEATYRGLHDGQGARFLGIPYGVPAVGTLRFRPPLAFEAEGVIDATRAGKAPPQIQRSKPDWAPRQSGFETGEDCLNLNLFTPAADGKRRPVIVHAFGGGFQTGSASGTFHDDMGFARRGEVVLVRPNMRVGALGFLHLGPVMGQSEEPANRGLMDFILALTWVRSNIAAFGGDPDNVTLVGMSSGAFTVGALFGVDGASHLFRRAWMMSGSASRIIAPDTATAMADAFLQRAAIKSGDWDALQHLDLGRILDIQERLAATHLGERNAPGERALGIVADGTSLKRHPLEGLSSGMFADHGIVVGWTRNEARMWYALGIMPKVETRAQLLASITRFVPDDAEGVLDRLQAQLPALNFTGIEEVFLSQAIYRDPAIRTVLTHKSAGGAAYAYEFAWVPPFEDGRLGAAHGFDEPFVFGDVSPGMIPLAKGCDRAPELAFALNRALYAFARTGNPGWPLIDDTNGPVKLWH